MVQGYRNTEAELDTILDVTSPESGQQPESWFVPHTKDASDASLAEFERLMAAMGYRRRESSV